VVIEATGVTTAKSPRITNPGILSAKVGVSINLAIRSWDIKKREKLVKGLLFMFTARKPN